MSIEDTLLMAYVDGELSAEGRREVEAAVTHSPELAERSSAMRASGASLRRGIRAAGAAARPAATRAPHQ